MKNINALLNILANRLRSQKLLPPTFWICLKMPIFSTFSVTNIQRTLHSTFANHSNHLKPQAHVHFNSESKEVFTKRILPILKNKKERLDSLLESFELSQENEIAFSASKYKTLIDEVKDVLYDKQVVQEFDLSKQQILVTKGETPQNDEEKKDHEEIDKNFKISGNFPKDNGFKLKIDDQIFLPPIQKFRDLVDQELKESYLLHTAFGNELQIEYNLLFRGSEDGFTNLDFRKKCCFAPNIIIFVLSEFDQVFGGFVSEIIQQKNGYIQDQGAFLFQLTKRQLMFQNGSYDSAVQFLEIEVYQAKFIQFND
eukprot:403365631